MYTCRRTESERGNIDQPVFTESRKGDTTPTSYRTADKTLDDDARECIV